MAQQPELTSPSLPASPAPLPGSASRAISVSGSPTPPIAVSISAPDLRPQTNLQAANPIGNPPQRIPRWLKLTLIFALIELEICVGGFLCIAPWTKMFWDQNYLFVQYPTLSIYAANGAVRGIISGLGLLNLWIAFHDAFKNRDPK